MKEIYRPNVYLESGKETVSIRLIDAVIAEKMLSKSKNLRHLHSSWVSDYAQINVSGKWGLSNDAIVIDSDGYLRNGQHRLKMIVVTGIAKRFVVLENVTPASDKTFDQGHRRSLSLIMNETNTFIGALKGFYTYPNLSRRHTWPVPAIEEANIRAGSIVKDTMSLVGSTHPMTLSPIYAAFARASFYISRQLLTEMIGVMHGEDGSGNPASPGIRSFMNGFIGISGRNGGGQARIDTYKRFQSAIKFYSEGTKKRYVRTYEEDLFPITKELELSEFVPDTYSEKSK